MSATQVTPNVTRRKPREDRRHEIINAACNLALSEGLGAITARRVASQVGVGFSLVTHYFSSIDELVSAAFSKVVADERTSIADYVRDRETVTEQLRATFAAYTVATRDPIGLLWLDAWRQAADRPLIRAAVVQQMELDLVDMKATIDAGVASGEFELADPSSVVAMRILALLDGQVAASAVRGALVESTLDYPAVEDLLAATAERELGLPVGALATD
ncbi:TetR family transcriptional regulator [Leifsonia shinshuensis]|uniref:TetR family transcriptional regulator n=1 Tax=Leifsonia shinshuensis TaxID=150026 RepID=UPI002855537D|nr:TetR family transcriptional regulator [Leifsonia shinshuensis]MDR6972867.1 DNA-binding transcriptional regulator YbjK [Leifsonia shinshuensis]